MAEVIRGRSLVAAMAWSFGEGSRGLGGCGRRSRGGRGRRGATLRCALRRWWRELVARGHGYAYRCHFCSSTPARLWSTPGDSDTNHIASIPRPQHGPCSSKNRRRSPARTASHLRASCSMECHKQKYGGKLWRVGPAVCIDCFVPRQRLQVGPGMSKIGLKWFKSIISVY